MGLRFRRTVKLLPGVRLNLSRSGVSTTVGVRGASVTLGKKGTYANVGLPGSGVSYRTRIDGEGHEHQAPEAGRKRSSVLPILVVALALGGGALAFFGLKTPQAQAPAPATPIASAPVAAAPVAAAPAAETVTIAKRSTALKAEPSRKSEKIGTAHQGDRFTVFSRQGVWLQVGHDKPEGWIAASALKPAR